MTLTVADTTIVTMNAKQILLLLSWVVTLGSGAPAADEVKSVPSCNFQPNFRHYSGYLNATSQAQLHYWLVESQANPQSDPVILWLNGGPGCSSLEGLLLELGPFHVHNFGDVVYENVYSWNKFATIVFLESPAGVGYSYSLSNNYTYTDDDVAKSNYNALLDFFKNKFPELQKNDFYIMGESYAGTYLPTLGSLLVDDKQNFGNLKGMAIGNGCLHARFNYNSLIPFVNNHALIDQNFYATTTAQCCNGNGGECDYYTIADQQPNSLCANLTTQLYYANYYSDLDPYNLYFTCYLDSSQTGVRNTYHRFQLRQLNLEKKVENLAQSRAETKAQSLPQCAHYNDTTIWLRRADVRKALNIPDSLPPYDSCSDAVTDNYIVQYTDMSQSVKKVVSAGVRVLLFVGDVDTVCNVMHTKQFADQLGLDLLNASYPWTFDDTLPSVAGYRTAYRGLDLLTVRGAGHFVSSQFEKPRETQQMIYNFVNNFDYSQSSGLNTSPQPTSPQPTSPQPTSPQPTSPQPTSPQPTTTQSTSSQPTSPQPTSPQPTSPHPTSSQTTSEQGHGSAAGGSRQQSPWEVLRMKSLYCCLFIIGRIFASVK